MAEIEKEGFLQKIDPQMWLTLIGFVFTLGIIYGEFQTMKNQIYIFEEKQKSFVKLCNSQLGSLLKQKFLISTNTTL